MLWFAALCSCFVLGWRVTDESMSDDSGEALPISRARGRGAAYLASLNPEQRAAVEALDGPVLVLAGAGTGKTRVLTTRLAHLLSTGRAKPWGVLAVTFTNKAAREMRERVEKLLGPGGGGLPWLGTFHSISARMLRTHAELVGLKNNFTILDTDDQVRLLKQIIEAEGIDEKRWPGAPARGRDRWLEEPRADAGESAEERSVSLRRRRGREALRDLPGAAENSERVRFRRSADAHDRYLPAPSGRAGDLSPQDSAT